MGLSSLETASGSHRSPHRSQGCPLSLSRSLPLSVSLVFSLFPSLSPHCFIFFELCGGGDDRRQVRGPTSPYTRTSTVPEPQYAAVLWSSVIYCVCITVGLMEVCTTKEVFCRNGLVRVNARRTVGAPMVPEHTPLRGIGVETAPRGGAATGPLGLEVVGDPTKPRLGSNSPPEWSTTVRRAQTFGISCYVHFMSVMLLLAGIRCRGRRRHCAIMTGMSGTKLSPCLCLTTLRVA
ncbi:hypothetical protein Sjap_000193 [Stephania japonica]|uniref:Uncharacterized protein n=1 Tax=Stephania japonica TaxID=461633 RepID=A0AAP0KHI7_9MAGN